MPSRPVSIGAAAAAVLFPFVAFAAPAAEGVLLPPTPLVLKDGRIAQVTVHTIRFPLGKDQPDEAEQAALAGLVDELATDCFLTAQAVGHVEPGPGSDGETLAAHRLARARADRVQAALTGRGLPASSIASVWDWQFAVREPRVTLWVFRLAAGDDCDSRPIARMDAPPAGAETPAPAAVETPAAPVAEPVPEMIVDASADAAAEAAVPPALEAPEAEAEPEPQPAPVSADSGATPLPAEPAQAAMPTAEAVAPAEAVEAKAEATDAVQEPDGAAAATLAITFDVNSSYFPKGTGRELKALVGGLQPYRTYEVVLEGAVSAEALRRGAEQDASAYNHWIADRRMDRVADWLRQNLGGSLSIRHSYVENDSSRRVMIRVHPVP